MKEYRVKLSRVCGLITVWAVVSIIGVESLMAQSFDDIENPATSNENTDYGAKVPNDLSVKSGDRVDTRDGNLIIEHKDLTIPGNGGMDIEISRIYDLQSLSSGMSTTHTQSQNWTALGPGWRISAAPRIVGEMTIYYATWEAELGLLRYGPSPNPVAGICVDAPEKHARGLYIEDEEGSKQKLYKIDKNTYITKNNWKVSCDNSEISAWSPDGNAYEFGGVDNIRYGLHYRGAVFSFYATNMYSESFAYINARRKVDSYGNWVKYEYWQAPGEMKDFYLSNDLVHSGVYRHKNPRLTYKRSEIEVGATLLSRIASSDGREVDFEYDQSNYRLKRIADNAGRKVEYSYQNYNDDQTIILSEVVRPDGTSWTYDYYPGDYIGSLSAGARYPLEISNVQARKLKSITYPTGGGFEYKYNYVEYLNEGRPHRREVVGKRIASTGDEWTYQYFRGGDGELDRTVVNGPEGTTTYWYYGLGYSSVNSIWSVGLLKEVWYPDGSQLVNEWGKRQVADYQDWLYDLRMIKDDKIWAPVLKEKLISREGIFVTKYYNHDKYGNPGEIEERGIGVPIDEPRITKTSYRNDESLWVLGKIESKVHPDRSEFYKYNAHGDVVERNINGVVEKYTYVQ